MIVANTTFHHAINKQRPNPTYPGQSGVGPLWFTNLTNFTFRNNSLWWADGGNAFLTVNSGIIERNNFTLSTSDKITVTASNMAWLNNNPTDMHLAIGDIVQRTAVRQMAVEFSKNLVVQNNSFSVTDGVLVQNNNDGETINDEGATLPKRRKLLER